MNREKKRLEDVRELMHRVQSRLPVKQAACTSVLSKSWLHAWSTIPNLRFYVYERERKRERGHMKMKLVDVERTLVRYLRDNIPIESFELITDIENQESASLAEKLIRSVATKTCIKQLSLNFQLYGASLHLPDEILSGENLTKIRVSVSTRGIHSVWMTTTHRPKCVSLRELHLSCVRISEELLHDILSSCSLLVKIGLELCSRSLNRIKVKNLPCLDELRIYTHNEDSTALEINHVENLRLLIYMTGRSKQPLINAHSISLGSSMTELNLWGGVITDNASLEMIIKSGLPSLESFTLDMACWRSRSFHFKCASIKIFSLMDCPRRLVNVVHVKAPKLRFFTFSGNTMPSLLFPDSTLEHINFQLNLRIGRLDASFFLKMREALALSTRCQVNIIATFKNGLPLIHCIDIDNLRTRLPFPPAKNVRSLSFRTRGDKCLWERSPFFDAFFEICHPKRVSARGDAVFRSNNHFCKMMLREVLEKNKTKTNATTSYWPRYLKHVRLQRPGNPEWETLTDSHTSFLDGQDPPFSIEFIPEWH